VDSGKVYQEASSAFDSTTPVLPTTKETVGREGPSQCCLATGNDSFEGPGFVSVVKMGGVASRFLVLE
jgi:hypothetical protein